MDGLWQRRSVSRRDTSNHCDAAAGRLGVSLTPARRLVGFEASFFLSATAFAARNRRVGVERSLEIDANGGQGSDVVVDVAPLHSRDGSAAVGFRRKSNFYFSSVEET